MKLRLMMYAIVYPIFLTLLVFTQGCARVPAGAAVTGTQLIVTMTVAGNISPNDFYFVLFNATSNPVQSQGPIPVVASPWGNGFAAGQFTGFVRVDSSQPNGGYGVYSVIPNTSLQTFSYLGSPINTTPVTGSSTFIQFTIPLSKFATSSLAASSITAVQMNFINTDRIPIDPNDPNTKEFDALGDARIPSQVNDPITIPVQQAGTYSNSSALDREPEGDVTTCGNGIFQTINNPNLDITDWTVQVVN